MAALTEKEEAAALKARIQALKADPALRDNPLMPEVERLAEDQLRLLRRTAKISRISDAFQGQLKSLNESLQALSGLDFLTGLPNRRSMMEALTAEQVRAQRSGEPLTVLMCDVDHFKVVNDTHGHAVGDEVLRTLGRALHDALRRYDQCARWGGEEFLVLLPDTELQGAREVAEKLRREAGGISVEAAGGVRVTVTLSVGVAQLDAGESVDSVLRRADVAMYDAKHAGRDRVGVDQKR
jgi:diguanylate cyclase